MTALAVTQAAAPRFTPAPSPLLQRSCACGGGSAGLTGKCSSCESEDRFGLSNLQPKLALSTPGDPYEQEADRIADQVVGLPGPGPLVASDEDLGGPGGGVLHRKVTPLIQRQAEDDQRGPDADREAPDDEDEMLQTRRISDQGETDTGPEFQARLDGERSGGAPLDDGVRADMESRFGVDLGGVRVHTGARSAELARSIHAEAFTLGSHVYFGSGYYDPRSTRGRHLLAHELTHTIQQARGAIRHLTPGAEATPAPAAAQVGDAAPTVQRAVEESFVPELLPDGEFIHATILEEFGEANPDLFTEVKIPGATSVSLADKAGRADMYVDGDAKGKSRKGATTPAVIMIDDEPQYLNSYANPNIKSAKGTISKLLKGGQPFQHKAEGAPRGVDKKEASCDDANPAARVCKVDKAPGHILLGDLKPPPSLDTFLSGTIQLGNYEKGIASTATSLNAYIKANPGKASPAGATWSPTTGKIPKLTIPKDRRVKSKTGKKVPLRLYDNRKQDSALSGLEGHLAVYKSKEAGIWTYEWVPQKIPAQLKKNATSPRVTKALTRLNQLVKQVKSPPPTTSGAKKARPGPPPPVALIQRKETFDKTKWPGEFKTWQETEAKPLLGSDAVAPLGKTLGVATPESEDAKALRVFEGVKELKARIPAEDQPAELAELPAGTGATAGGLKRLQLWARWGPLFGRLRGVMGDVFVKIVNLYDKAKGRFDAARAKFSANEPSSGGSIGKAIVTGVFKVATTFFKVLVERVTSTLKRSLTQAASVIVEDLVGEERVNKIVEAKGDFEAMVAGVEARVAKEIEDLEALTKPYEDIFKTLADVQKAISDIMKLVSIVRWGLRIVQCVTPPGLGCLKLLLQAVAEELAAKVISSCWFVLNFIKPMLSTFKIFTDLPGQVSAFIMEQVKKVAGLLPISKEVLDKAFATPTVSVAVTSADLDCDAKVITPAQREMNLLLDTYGPAKIREMIQLLEAAGMSKDAEMTVADVKILRGLLKKIEDGEITKEGLKDAVANLKAGKGSGEPAIDDVIAQLSGLGGGSGGKGPAKPGGGGGDGDPAGTPGGTVKSVPFSRAKTKTKSGSGSVARGGVMVAGSSPDHKKGDKVTIGLIGLVDDVPVIQITGVPATVEDVVDVMWHGKAYRKPVYRLLESVEFEHGVAGVPTYMFGPDRTIGGKPFPVEEQQPEPTP